MWGKRDPSPERGAYQKTPPREEVFGGRGNRLCAWQKKERTQRAASGRESSGRFFEGRLRTELGTNIPIGMKLFFLKKIPEKPLVERERRSLLKRALHLRSPPNEGRKKPSLHIRGITGRERPWRTLKRVASRGARRRI